MTNHPVLQIMAFLVALAAAQANRDQHEQPERERAQPEPWYLIPQKLTVRVLNEAGVPVEGAHVAIGMENPFLGPEGYDDIVALSDADGRASHEAPGNSLAAIVVKKEGHYRSGVIRYRWDMRPVTDLIDQGKEIPPGIRREPWNPEVEVVLVEKQDPVTMKELWGIRLPEFDREYGYDLLVGDLVAPHGEGKHADLLLRTELEALEDEMYIVVMEMEFTGQGNGMMRVEELPFPDSEFKYLRQAPEEGYEIRTFQTGSGSLGLHRQNPGAEQVEQFNNLFLSKVTIQKNAPEAWVFRIRQELKAGGEGPHYGIFVRPFTDGYPLYFTASPAFGGGDARINLSIRGVLNPIVGSRSLEVGPPAPMGPPPPGGLPVMEHPPHNGEEDDFEEDEEGT